MFSSFNSFLPTVFQSNADARSPQPTPTTEDVVDEPEEQPAVEQADQPSTVRKREKKEKPAYETFIVVRPPPSKTNHPLNLQVQLVPPSSRQDRRSGSLASLDPAAAAAATATVAAAATADQSENGSTMGHDLQRIASNRSETSTYSGYTSGAASVSSFASTSTSSSRRMIIPLYNLQAHNVLQNIIVDAGTDAKVAKFGKRGMEIVGLAVLEPTEVWGAHTLLPGGIASAGRSSARASLDEPPRDHGMLPKMQTPERPFTATGAPQSSLSAFMPPSATDLTPTAEVPQQQQQQQQPQKGSKKLFSRMFKRKDQGPQRPPASNADLGASLSPQPRRLLPRPSAELSRNSIALDQGISADTPPPTGTTLCPAVLGVQPTLYPPVFPPKGRPTKYVWVVRKWLKGTDTGILNGMMGKLSVGNRSDVQSAAAALPHVELRFEWTRKKEKHERRGEKKARRANLDVPAEGQTVSRRGSTALSSDSHSVDASGNGNGNGNGNGPACAEHPDDSLDSIPHASHGKKKRRHSLSRQSIGSSIGASEDPHDAASSTAHGSGTGAGYDSGDETDPEDSDTPWSCTLALSRLAPPGAGGAHQHQSSPGPGTLRLKVAVLSPTPHHPKVVGLLKVPFPLPDVEVDALAVCRRSVTPAGVMRTVRADAALVLTAEEIKDAVSTTALWLVVRESFGGVGRDRRKGDGWRIRG